MGGGEVGQSGRMDWQTVDVERARAGAGELPRRRDREFASLPLLLGLPGLASSRMFSRKAMWRVARMVDRQDGRMVGCRYDRAGKSRSEVNEASGELIGSLWMFARMINIRVD